MVIRLFRASLLVLLISVVAPALQAGVIREYRADYSFNSRFELFYAGPQWFLNALPGSTSTLHPRGRVAQLQLDRTGDSSMIEAAYLGTLRNPFDVSLFNTALFLGQSQYRKTSTPLVLDIVNGSTKDFTGSVSNNLNNANNYSPTGLPANTDDVRLSSTATALTMTSSNLTMESLNVTNSKGYTITNNTTVGTNSSLTLGNAAGFTNSVSTIADDLIFLNNNSALVIQGPNGSTGSGVLNLILASSGNFNVATGSVLNISSVISGASKSIALSNSGTVLFGGVNTYSGDTIINAGDLRFSVGASSNSSTIRLGNTSGSALATLSLGNGGTGGVSLTSPLEVRAGGTGARVIRSLDTSGTDTFGGAITMNANLTVEPRTGNTLLFQGGSIDLKTNTLTVDSQNDQNGSDNVNFQGTVRINEIISGNGGSIVKDGSATLILQGASNTYTGGTTIAGGILGIFGDGSLGAVPTSESNNIFFAASSASNPTAIHTLRADAAGISLSANRDINIATGVTATFDSNGNTFTINGSMNGDGNIAKTGAGTLTLTGPNFVTGTATITAGTLNAAANSALGSGALGDGVPIGPSSIVVNSGGTLMLSGAGQTDRVRSDAPISLSGTIGRGADTITEGTGATRTGPLNVSGTSKIGLGALTLTSNATLDFNLLNTSGVATFTFASFDPGTFILNVLNWSSSNANFTAQTSGVDGTDNRLIFAGPLPPNVTSITFNGIQAGIVPLDEGFYEVVPVPEPGTWIGAALALGVIGLAFAMRRKACPLL